MINRTDIRNAIEPIINSMRVGETLSVDSKEEQYKEDLDHTINLACNELSKYLRDNSDQQEFHFLTYLEGMIHIVQSSVMHLKAIRENAGDAIENDFLVCVMKMNALNQRLHDIEMQYRSHVMIYKEEVIDPFNELIKLMKTIDEFVKTNNDSANQMSINLNEAITINTQINNDIYKFEYPDEKTYQRFGEIYQSIATLLANSAVQKANNYNNSLNQLIQKFMRSNPLNDDAVESKDELQTNSKIYRLSILIYRNLSILEAFNENPERVKFADELVRQFEEFNSLFHQNGSVENEETLKLADDILSLIYNHTINTLKIFANHPETDIFTETAIKQFELFFSAYLKNGYIEDNQTEASANKLTLFLKTFMDHPSLSQIKINDETFGNTLYEASLTLAALMPRNTKDIYGNEITDKNRNIVFTSDRAQFDIHDLVPSINEKGFVNYLNRVPFSERDRLTIKKIADNKAVFDISLRITRDPLAVDEQKQSQPAFSELDLNAALSGPRFDELRRRLAEDPTSFSSIMQELADEQRSLEAAIALQREADAEAEEAAAYPRFWDATEMIQRQERMLTEYINRRPMTESIDYMLASIQEHLNGSAQSRQAINNQLRNSGLSPQQIDEAKSLDLNTHQTQALISLHDTGLTAAQLDSLEIKNFDDHHQNALIELIRNQGLAVADALSEIDKLNGSEAHALQLYYRNGLRNNHLNILISDPVSEFADLNSHQINLLVKYRIFGLSGNDLRNIATPFTNTHEEAFYYLINEIMLSPKSVAHELNNLNETGVKTLLESYKTKRARIESIADKLNSGTFLTKMFTHSFIPQSGLNIHQLTCLEAGMPLGLTASHLRTIATSAFTADHANFIIALLKLNISAEIAVEITKYNNQWKLPIDEDNCFITARDIAVELYGLSNTESKTLLNLFDQDVRGDDIRRLPNREQLDFDDHQNLIRILQATDITMEHWIEITSQLETCEVKALLSLYPHVSAEQIRQLHFHTQITSEFTAELKHFLADKNPDFIRKFMIEIQDLSQVEAFARMRFNSYLYISINEIKEFKLPDNTRLDFIKSWSDQPDDLAKLNKLNPHEFRALMESKVNSSALSYTLTIENLLAARSQRNPFTSRHADLVIFLIKSKNLDAKQIFAEIVGLNDEQALTLRVLYDYGVRGKDLKNIAAADRFTALHRQILIHLMSQPGAKLHDVSVLVHNLKDRASLKKKFDELVAKDQQLEIKMDPQYKSVINKMQERLVGPIFFNIIGSDAKEESVRSATADHVNFANLPEFEQVKNLIGLNEEQKWAIRILFDDGLRADDLLRLNLASEFSRMHRNALVFFVGCERRVVGDALDRLQMLSVDELQDYQNIEVMLSIHQEPLSLPGSGSFHREGSRPSLFRRSSDLERKQGELKNDEKDDDISLQNNSRRASRDGK